MAPPKERLRVLVVEDELLIAMALADMLGDLGYVVVGPAPTVRQALSLVQSETVHLAILDVNLHDGRSEPVAEELVQQNVPFVVATAVPRHELPERAYGSATQLLSKPVCPNALRKTVQRLASDWNTSVPQTLSRGAES